MKSIQLRGMLFCLIALMYGSINLCFADINANLIASWQFEDNLLDSGPNGYDGTATGDLTFEDGFFNRCIFLDGDDCIDTADFQVGNTFSVSLLVNPTTTNDGQFFLGKHSLNGSVNLFLLGFWAGGYNVWVNGMNFSCGTKKTGWQHVAVTVQANTEGTQSHIIVYVDGEPVGDQMLGTVIGDCSGKAWTIGQEWDGETRSDYLTGQLDDLRIYDGALTEQEIRELAGDFYIHEIWVDDDYTEEGSNDGHIWGVTAFDTIQDGIDAASDGYTVYVAEGTYYENVTLKNGIKLIGENRETTIIDGNNLGCVITSNHCEPITIVEGFTVTNGSAFNGGGMANWNHSEVTVRNCLFLENTCTGHGGAMYNNYSYPTITDCDFVDNSCEHRGGAICNNTQSPATITNCRFVSNTSYETAGAVSNCYDSNSIMTDCLFMDNTTTNIGGAVTASSHSDIVLTGCRFINNFAINGGAAAVDSYGGATILNCAFIGNTASASGGAVVNWYYSDSLVTNCTFAGNSANAGGAVYNRQDSEITISNSILWGNTASSGNEILNYAGNAAVFQYSDISGSGGSGTGWDSSLGNDGGGNIDVNPSFVDVDGDDDVFGTDDDDVSLSAGSPCIDAGDNSLLTSEMTVDLAGSVRLFDDILMADTGAGTPPIVDMGAYERSYPVCGDVNHPYPIGDVDKNCIVDLGDLAMMSQHWLEDNRPE